MSIIVAKEDEVFLKLLPGKEDHEEQITNLGGSLI